MKKIICPECGEVPFYTLLELLFYNVDGTKVDMTEVLSSETTAATVKRCCYCQRKVKIYPVDEEQRSVPDDISTTNLLEGEKIWKKKL